MPTEAAALNREYYDHLQAGRDDYWRYMAAPRHRVAVIRRELAALRPGSVVDLGCGNGMMLREVGASLPGAVLAGIDISVPQIDANRAAFPGTRWLAADLDGGAPLPEDWRARFAAVLAMEIVEHLDRPAEFLRRARELAEPGGRLLLSTQSGQVRETERRVGHRRHWSRSEITELLRSSGWEPERVWNTGWPFHDLSKWWANRDPDASIGRFGSRRYGARERAVCLALRTAFRLNSGRRGAQLFAVSRNPGGAP